MEKLPVYYIGPKPNKNLENNCKEFGFNNITFYPEVKGRKFKANKLFANNIISARSYNDLILGRREHSGISSIGAIGCFMSHYNLWKLCVIRNFPYMVILENDCKIKSLNNDTKNDIMNFLQNNTKSIFVSANIKNVRKKHHEFMGLHFYIVSKSACEILIRNSFPIDVQADWYIVSLYNKNMINLKGQHIFDQKLHKSSIQDACVPCNFPTKLSNYVTFFLLVLCLITLFASFKT